MKKLKEMKKLTNLDVVKTRFGTLAVVEEVCANGDVSLVLPKNSEQKHAWYEPKELTYIGSIKELVGNMEKTK